eukprot:366039-Chlamydomonas_euryale.AAC.12
MALNEADGLCTKGTVKDAADAGAAAKEPCVWHPLVKGTGNRFRDKLQGGRCGMRAGPHIRAEAIALHVAGHPELGSSSGWRVKQWVFANV